MEFTIYTALIPGFRMMFPHEDCVSLMGVEHK